MQSSRQLGGTPHARVAGSMRAEPRAVIAAAIAAISTVAALALDAGAQYPGPHNQLQYNQLLYNEVQANIPAVRYNDSAATESPRISQPQTLTPVRAYAPAPYPTTGAGIIQPEYLTPVKEAPVNGAVANKPAVAPLPQTPTTVTLPVAATSLAAPRKPIQVPPPVTAEGNTAKTSPSSKPAERSGFWQFVLGPSDSSSTQAQAAPAAPQREHFAASQPSSQPANNSLWTQFLGRNATSQPKPEPPVASTKSTPAPAANPLQLAAAEESNTWWPYPRPSAQDIQDAKTPAVSATITVSGGLPPANSAPTAATAMPSQANTPNTAGIPPVPTVPGMTHSEMTSAAYGLWQPFQMTNDAPVAPMPVGENIRKNAKSERQSRSQSDSVPSLLQPFYATNGTPPSNRQRTSSPTTAADAQPTSITDALIASPLGRQLTMESDEDLRTSGLASIEAEAKPNQPWDGTVTVQWPLMSNPFVMTEATQPPAIVPSSVSQVAFMQEPLPTPPATTPSPDELGLPDGVKREDDENDEEDAANRTAGGSERDKKDTLVGAETLGNAPDDNTLEFLRTQTVLLAPGKHQFDIGIEYTLTENDFPILLSDGMGNIIGVDNVEIKGRELAMPMELRYGLLPKVQGFIQVPIGWSNVQAAIDNYDEYENDGGIGDVGFGLTAQLRDAYKDCPYIIGTLAGLAPTGGDPFGTIGQITPNAPSLGNGFWAISANLLWVQTRYDPVVLFYGFGTRYQFEHEYFGIEFEPGMEYNYTLGTGFAVNERVTLSAQFFGAYVEEIKANGERVEGTIQEPMNLRLAATLAKPCNRLVEPFVVFGLTDDAISSNIGITWTY